MTILEIRNISKSYGKIQAVKGLSITVQKGTVFGILGPNGSGKTTTLSIIAGILKPQTGSYRWFEQEPSKWLNRKVGSLIEIPYFYPYLSLYHNLKIHCLIKDVPEKDIERVLEITGLTSRKGSRFDTLSLGMKQRLALASVLLGDPEVLVLDEPANGLDPEGIAEVRNIIKLEGEKGKTIILASHILDEVEKVCSHVGILKWGQLIASGKVNELLVEDDTIIISSERMNELHELLVRAGFVKTSQCDEQEITLTLAEEKTPADLNAFVFKNGFTLSRLEVRKKSLESQFLELVR